ncbi:hypothetical protein H0A43_07375 [Arcobacter lanthieri]|uniref:hypothetical protein n=1 Tax=Aliarcobacter lanthieri TaxID=1355374 RepID=UPI001923E283|nr:hypothetical protein [Aliarcobacter lanthieri]MBL3520292.1 hypothetical protein [Aliarcobacter lanthieri]
MAYSQEIWQKAKTLFELGYSLQAIADECKIKDKSSITKRAKKDNWIKAEIQQLKNDIIDYEEQNSTLEKKKSTLVEKLATLDNFEGVTTIQNIIEDEIGRKSLLFSTATLALIRKNQMLTRNTKTVIEFETTYSDEGKPLLKRPIEIQMELSPADLKTLSEGADKDAISLEIAQRHSNSQVTVNNQNNIQNNNIPLTLEQAEKEALALGVPLEILIK